MRRALLFLCGTALASQFPTGEARFFDSKVAPILMKRCLGCHNNELNDGNISFEERDTLLKGGTRGAAVVPGNPEASLLVDAIQYRGDLRMPPGSKLPSKDINTLTDWIRRGAPWGTRLTGNRNK